MAVVRNLMVRSGADFSALYREMNNAQKRMTAFQRGMKKAMKGLSVVLGGLAIGKLVKDSLSAASELEGAFVGLESILTGQGKSFTRAQGFINDYIQDGLIPLTDAITAYKNLAARGYNDEQIQQTMERLKDAAAFGRQASYTLGEAVRTATEGLKNENSVLVDNAGVTKNVSKMWDDYAKSIGKTRNQLTQAEKIQAEVNGIIQETQWQVGDAARYADTYAGRLAALGKTLRDIKINFGNAFMPIVNIVLPLLQTLANWLSRVTAVFAAFSQALFGKAPKAQAKATQAQAGAMGDLGDATEEAGKKAKGALLGFDEINQLDQDKSGGAGIEVGGAGVENLLEGVDEGTGGIMDEISTKAQAIAEKVKAAFDTVRTAIVSNKDIIVPALGAIAGALAGLAVYTTITNLATTFKTLSGVISEAWGVLAANPAMLVVIAIGALIGALVTAYKTNDKFRETVDKLWERIKTALSPVLEKLGEILTWLWQSVIAPLGRIITDVLVVAFQGLLQVAQWLWQYVLEPLGRFAMESLVPTFLAIANIVGFVLKEAIEAIIFAMEFWWNGVLKPIVTWFGDTFMGTFNTVGEGIKTVIEGLQDVFDGLIKFITGVFTGNWKQAWDGVKQIFKGVFDSLWGIVKVPLNLIIDGINWVIGGLNKLKITIPDWVKYVPGLSGLAGRSWGINIPNIPRLANGGITNGPTLAMIGDNPGGREVVSPLDDLTDIIASAVGTAVLQAMQVGGQGDSGRPVVLNLDGREVARGIIPALDNERNRVGGFRAELKPV